MKTLVKISFVLLMITAAVSCTEKKTAENTNGVVSDTTNVVNKADTIKPAPDTVVNK